MDSELISWGLPHGILHKHFEKVGLVQGAESPAVYPERAV
jgi:hypothetical protein